MNYSQRLNVGRRLYAMRDVLPESLRAAFDAYLQGWREAELARLIEEISAAKEVIWKLPFKAKLAAGLLSEWSHDQVEQSEKNRDAKCVKRLKSAADRILGAYGPLLRPDYEQALRNTFSEPQGHTYCYACYHSPEDWVQRLNELNVQGAFNVKNIKGYTGTAQGLVRYNVTTLHHPGVRRIDFPHDANDSTLVHEMLHWCCNEDFLQGFLAGMRSQQQVEDVNEGITEYLARQIMGPAGGGYAGLIEKVTTVIGRDTDFRDEIYSAYFLGTNAANVAARLASELEEETRLAVQAARLGELRSAWAAAVGRGQTNPTTARDWAKNRLQNAVTIGQLTFGEVSSVVSNQLWANFLQPLCAP
jgi:hypothetical protein